jgi:hypothetical protein
MTARRALTDPPRRPGVRCALLLDLRREGGRRENTHGTEFRELLYPWHPWHGLRVSIHATIDKLDGIVFRCSLSGADAERWLEVPACMFDRSACARVREAADAHVDLAALTRGSCGWR